jgi:hypothetical protein
MRQCYRDVERIRAGGRAVAFSTGSVVSVLSRPGAGREKVELTVA